jgi:hypothetical protein
MGAVVTKLDSSNKVIEVKHEGQASQNPKTKISQETLDKYKDQLNSKGGFIISIRLLAIIDLVKKYYNLAKEGLTAEEFKTIPNPEGFAGAIFLSLFSQYGLFTMIEQPNAGDKPEFIKIIVPMALLKNDTEFINFVFINFGTKILADQPAKTLEDLKNLFTAVVLSLNKNSTDPVVRLVNILNLSVHIGIIAAVLSYSKSKKISENPAIFSELISPLISSFPDDACYFNTNNLITFTPDVCQNKKQSQTCPVCPTSSTGQNCPSCPACSQSNDDSTFKYISVGLGLLALVFLILYLTKKTTVISESESE